MTPDTWTLLICFPLTHTYMTTYSKTHARFRNQTGNSQTRLAKLRHDNQALEFSNSESGVSFEDFCVGAFEATSTENNQSVLYNLKRKWKFEKVRLYDSKKVAHWTLRMQSTGGFVLLNVYRIIVRSSIFRFQTCWTSCSNRKCVFSSRPFHFN